MTEKNDAYQLLKCAGFFNLMRGTTKCHFLSSDHMFYFLLAHPTPASLFSNLADCKQGTFQKLFRINSTPRKSSAVPEAEKELVELSDRKGTCCPGISGGFF